MNTTLYKLGGRYYNLDAVFRIDPAYDPTEFDRRHPPGLGVEVVFGDLKSRVFYGAEADTLRAFLAGELASVRHYGIGVRAEVIDFTHPGSGDGGAGPNT